jgi:hypothetical protein
LTAAAVASESCEDFFRNRRRDSSVLPIALFPHC